jgi:hypothetical protein
MFDQTLIVLTILLFVLAVDLMALRFGVDSRTWSLSPDASRRDL